MENYDKKYFEEWFAKNLPCYNGTCESMRSCIMDSFIGVDKKGRLIPGERKKIVGNLVEITLKANEKMKKLFEKGNKNHSSLSVQAPIFYLNLHFCKEYHVISPE